jgi:hypothetical protein
MYRRNKLVRMGVKSHTLEYDTYFLKIILEDGVTYSTTTDKETCVRNKNIINKNNN